MSQTSKKVTLVISAAVLCSFIYMIVVGVRSVLETGYASCVSSLTDAILKQEVAIAIQEKHENWKILDDAQLDLVMSAVKPGDCNPNSDPKFDYWGNRIHVALRKESKDRWPPIIVWSDGRDGISNTEDDIVMPYGQAIPK